MQKQLFVAADEICRILEILMNNHKADDSRLQCKLQDVTVENETHVHRTGTLYITIIVNYLTSVILFCTTTFTL